jgi:hypothetical protein
MKRNLKVFGVVFPPTAVVAASTQEENNTTKEYEEEKTRSDCMTSKDYYWCEGRKISLIRLDNKSFLIFRSCDRLSLLSSLNKKGIEVNTSNIMKYEYGGTDLSGDAAKSFLDYKWAEVDINHMSAIAIPEVVYAAPYYSGQDGYEFPMTNLVYVYLKNAGDLTLLEKLSKEYNVGMIGNVPKMPLWYVVACTKDSKGNALSVANSFYESGLFVGAEPAFISRRTLVLRS